MTVWSTLNDLPRSDTIELGILIPATHKTNTPRGQDLELSTSYKNIQPNDEAERYIRKKVDRLARHLKPPSDARLEISRMSSRSLADRVVAQITLTAGGRTLRAQQSGANLSAAIDAVVNVMDRQISRYKGRFYRTSQARRSARAAARGDGRSVGVEGRDSDGAESD